MTSPTTYCLHTSGYVPAGSCEPCEQRRERVGQYPDRSPRVVAKRAGWCELCDLAVEAGTEIRAYAGDGWVHAQCLDDAEAQAEDGDAVARWGDEWAREEP